MLSKLLALAPLLLLLLLVPTCTLAFSGNNGGPTSIGQISQTIKVTSRRDRENSNEPPAPKKSMLASNPSFAVSSTVGGKKNNNSNNKNKKGKKDITTLVEEVLETDPDDETVLAFLKDEYTSWALQHNKTETDDRFDIFKENFLATIKAFESTGKYHALNQYADLSPEEYQVEKKSQADEVEDYARSEYKAWAKQYKKTQSEERYQAFKTNLLLTMKIFEESGKFNALNEHGDMSREEFLRMQTKLAISGSGGGGGGGGRTNYGGTSSPMMGAGGMGGVSAQSFNSIPPSDSSAAAAQSYSRPAGMTFTPVSPKSSSDVLNNNGGGSSSGGDYYGGSSSGMDYGSSSTGGGGGNQWGAYQTPSMGAGASSSGGAGNPYGGQAGYGGTVGAGGYGGTSNPYQDPNMMGGGYGGAMSPPPSYDRPSEATFTPITPGSQSDLRGGGANAMGGIGSALGSFADGIKTAMMGSNGGGGGSSSDYTWSNSNNGSSNNNNYSGRATGGGRSMTSYNGNSGSGYAGGSYAGSMSSYSASSYDRPSEATFTPITPGSQSDLRGGGGGSSSPTRGRSSNDNWAGKEWGAPRPNYYDVPPSPSGQPQPSMYPSPPSYGGTGSNGMNGGYSSSSSSSYGGGSSSAASYNRPSEMTFTPVTPNSSSDVLKPSGSSSSGDSDTWPGMEWGAPPPRNRGGGGSSGGRQW